MPIIFWNILTITSNLCIWWNPTILNMLHGLIPFTMFTIRENCMVIWKIIHLNLVCNVWNPSAPIQLHKCVNIMPKVISPRVEIMKYGILRISCLYSKRKLFSDCVLCLLEFGNLQMSFLTIPRVQIYATFNFLVRELHLF